jgi:ribonuclease HI
VVPGGAYASGAEAATTNNRMELAAVLVALQVVTGPVVVFSKSKYVVDGFNQRWYVGWEERGWRNAKREPIANQDLWQPLVALFRARTGELAFRWVKGKATTPTGELVDRMAVEAATTQVGRHGDTPPTALSPAEWPTRQRAATSRYATGDAPAGHRVMVFGHRPGELGGYGETPVAATVRRRITEILRGLRAVYPDLLVLTGLGLGAEQLGAEAAAAAGVPYVAVLAFPGQEKVWTLDNRTFYHGLVDAAAATVVLSVEEPATKQAAGKAIGLRNEWMITHAHAAVVVWNGQDATLGAVTRALQRRIPDDVWVVAPDA